MRLYIFTGAFTFYKRDPTDALLSRSRKDDVSPGYVSGRVLSRGNVSFFFFLPASSVIDCWLLREGRRRPRARKRRGAFSCICIYIFASFVRYFLRFSFLFLPLKRILQHYETVVGCVLLSCLIARDSCVLRSPAGLKPDKDYHTPDVLLLHLPVVRVKALL